MPEQPSLGDGPIEAQYIEMVQYVAKQLNQAFNGSATGDDRTTGFVLLVFPFGESEGRCNYISNGAAREDIITLFEEQIKRFKEADPAL